MNDFSNLYNIDILCINCQDMINVATIDEHSGICTKPSQIINAVENFERFEKIDFQMEKLIAKIEKIILNENDYPFYQRTKEEDILQLKEIVIIAKNLLVLNIIDNHSIENIDENIENLKSISKEFDGGPGIYLYIQRLKQLAKEKYKEISSRLHDQENLNPVKYYFTTKKFTGHKRCHTKKFSSGQFEKITKNLIFDDIQSTCGRRSKTAIEIFPNFYSKTSNNNESESKNYLFEENNSKSSRCATLNFLTNHSFDETSNNFDSYNNTCISNTSQKKFEQRSFYMLCLEMKKQIENSDPCQKVSIPLLFQEACELNVQKENWREFIEESFRNPMKYFCEKKNSTMFRERIRKFVY